jgi:hypothetical protein
VIGCSTPDGVEALKAITLYPADIVGIGDRLGSPPTAKTPH